jgi:hypothetical protein
LIGVIRVIRGLWFVGFDKRGLYRRQGAEEPVVLVVRSGGEEESVVWPELGLPPPNSSAQRPSIPRIEPSVRFMRPRKLPLIGLNAAI